MCRQVLKLLVAVAALIAPAAPGTAGEADVLAAEAQRTGANTWRFTVTVKHADTGWEHYANRFDIVSPDGEVLGVRTLYHPHVDEQPFTRSLSGVAVPAGATLVRIRARDSKHGFSAAEFVVDLPR